MMDWTDRHCRFFHRLLTKRARLYTEMVTTTAVLHGDRRRLIGLHGSEHPVALQLGGCEPDALAACAMIGEDFGTRNQPQCRLPIGSRCRKAALRRLPDGRAQLVAEGVAAMKRAV